MYSPLLFEMLAQNRTDEVAAAAEQRRAAAERAEFRPEYQPGLIRFARTLISSVANEMQRVRALAGGRSAAITSSD
jgi:hypothetical protein